MKQNDVVKISETKQKKAMYIETESIPFYIFQMYYIGPDRLNRSMSVTENRIPLMK